jgi:hypothetical protein
LCFANALVNSAEHFDNTLLVHFLVQIAVVSVRLRRLPTVGLLAGVDARVRGLVKTEVKCFAGVDFFSDFLAEVLVGNQTVTVGVQLVEEFLETVLSHVYSPVVEHVAQFLRPDCTRLVEIQIREGLTEGLPLVLNLRENFGLQV